MKRKNKIKFDLTNKTFGKLKVKAYNSKKPGTWICECTCGNTKIVRGSALRRSSTKSCGCGWSGRTDRTGTVINGITFVKKLNKKAVSKYRASFLWKLKCFCGNYFISRASQVIQKRYKHSCGCTLKPSIDACWNAHLLSYKNGAEKRNIKFNINKKDFIKIASKNCFYCGDSPENKKSKNGKFRIDFFANGIDRINSNKNYDKNNCVPCCKICNYMKRDFKYSIFIDKISKIYTNLVRKKE